MEGPAVPERAKRGSETRDREWSWVEATVWTPRMLAALGNGVKGGKWYSLMDKAYRRETLWNAWLQVRSNAGAAGVDGQSVERFAARAEQYVEELERALKEGTYRPQAVRRVEIPKGGGKSRPLGIPTVKDRVVQTALKRVIEPIFEHEFRDRSYGFRPGRGAKDALREVDRWLKQGYTHVVDADLQSYFDTIPWDGLMARVRERIGDGSILKLIDAYLHQQILQGLDAWQPTQGTPQGAVLSPLLANVYLHPLDVTMEREGHRMVRYADDFVVLCRSAEEAARALETVRAWVRDNGLSLHPDKTHVGDCRVEGEGFEFLGYRFEAGRRWVRRKSLQAFRGRIRAQTRRTAGKAIEQIVEKLNPMLRGWFEYFKHAYPTTFPSLDGWIRRRLRAILRKQEKRPALGRCRADHTRWPNAYFAGLGLFALTEAHALASRSR